MTCKMNIRSQALKNKQSCKYYHFHCNYK